MLQSMYLYLTIGLIMALAVYDSGDTKKFGVFRHIVFMLMFAVLWPIWVCEGALQIGSRK